MRRKRLFWILVPSYWIVVILAIAAVTGYACITIKGLYKKALSSQLAAQTHLIAQQLSTMMAPHQPDLVYEWCTRLADATGMDIAVVLPSGQLFVRSSMYKSDVSLLDLPEIKKALSGKIGNDERYNAEQGQYMVYIAEPLKAPDGVILGVVTTSRSLASVNRTLNKMLGKILRAGLVIGLIAIVISMVVVRRISVPLEQIRQAAMLYACGDFSQRILLPNSEELAQLAETVNGMAEQLSETLETMRRTQGRQQAILQSLNEGILAVDKDEKVVNLNLAASRILGVDIKKVKGGTVQEAVRYAALQRFILQALARNEPCEEEIPIYSHEDEMILETYASVLHDANGQTIGAAIVLRDITRLRRLEAIRRDFVSNVSHELKTPITSIKGFSEALMEGGGKDKNEARHFIKIINRQAERMDAIINDLLLLAQMEQQSNKEVLSKMVQTLRPVLKGALEVCHTNAREKNMQIELKSRARLKATINAPLLEQAVVNLIDNAIKYSEPGKHIVLSADEEDGWVVVSVRDEGHGIEKEHLPRLFERFYRVDKARSRKLGGTGLGLAIVKHITQAHGGRIDVESEPGRGSTFRIFLPNK